MARETRQARGRERKTTSFSQETEGEFKVLLLRTTTQQFCISKSIMILYTLNEELVWVRKFWFVVSDISCTCTCKVYFLRVSSLITKITISLIVIGLKNSYFPLIHLPSCYLTVGYGKVCYQTVWYWTVQ